MDEQEDHPESLPRILKTAEDAWERFDGVPPLVDVVLSLMRSNPAYLKESREIFGPVECVGVVGFYEGKPYKIVARRTRSEDGRMKWESIKYAAPCDPMEYRYENPE